MIEVKKNTSEFGYDIKIKTKEGEFHIGFGGNLDLYWNYNDFEDKKDNKSFIITKENYFVFELFDNLYNEIKNCEVHKKDDYYPGVDVEKLNKNVMKFNHSQYELLFHDDKVAWSSDNAVYAMAPSFVIEKINDDYKVTFYKGLTDNKELSYEVVISNSGSRYQPFNIPFMRMYQRLFDYNPEYSDEFHQIHMEEYLYHKKLARKKETI